MKKKFNKLFFAVSFVAALFALSCSSFDDDPNTESDSKNTAKSYITLSVNEGGERTALPDIDLSEFTSFKLTGNKLPAEGEDVATGSVTSIGVNGAGVTWSSIDAMKADAIGLSEGDWNFYLEATVAQGSKKYAVYRGALLKKTIGSGKNELEFTLSLDALNTTNGGSGNLEIKINLDSEAASKVTAVGGRLLNSDGSVYTTDGGTADTFRLLSKTNGTNGAVSYTYEYPEKLQGVFVAQFRFYADEISSETAYENIDVSSLEVPIATWRDAVNINSYGAKDEINLKADDFDKTYTITYLQRINFAEEKDISFLVAGSNNNTNIYSRRSAITLVAPQKNDYTFYRWVEVLPVTGGSDYVWLTDSDNTRAAENGVTTKIAAGTIGDKYFCAEFIDENASKVIDHVTITADGTDGIVTEDGEQKVRVGHILTATPYTTESDSEEFTALVTWFWYVDDTLVKTDKTYTETALATYETDEKLPTVTDGSTTTVSIEKNQIMIPASWCGKTVKVKALQNYIVTTGADGKISNIKENAALYTANNSDSTVEFKEKAHAVTAGKLTINSGDKLVKLSTGDLVSLIGTEIDSTKLTFTGGVLSDAQSAWDIAKSGSQGRVTLTAVTKDADDNDILLTAPETSGNKDILVKFEVDGYETLYATITDVPVSVKAKRPLASEFTFKDPQVVTKNKIRFNTYVASGVDTTETYTLGDETKTVASGVARTDGEETLEYSFDKEYWNDWVTNSSETQRYDDDPSPEISALNETETYSNVYVRVKATSGGNGIAASDAVEIPLTNHIGTLVRLASVQLSYTKKVNTETHTNAPTTGPEVGTTISVTLVPDSNGSEAADITARSYDYLWSVEGVTLESGNTGATFDITDGSWVGKKLSVTVTPTYDLNSRGGHDTVEPTTDTTASEQSTKEEIVTGQLDISDTVAKLAYVDSSAVAVKELPGATPLAENLRMVSGGAVVTSLAQNYLATAGADTDVPVTFAFVPNWTNDEDPNDTAVVVRPSTDSKYYESGETADGSKAPIDVTISATGYYDETVTVIVPVDMNAAARLLYTTTNLIPIGHIRFNDDAVNNILQYQVASTEGDLTENGWKTVTNTPMSKIGEYNETATDGVINVSAQLANDKFFKVGDIVWARYANSKTKTPFPVKLTAAYIGTHGAIVSISIDETAPGLTVVGNVVTAPNGKTNTYTWTVNDEDVHEGTEGTVGVVSNDGTTFTVTVDYSGVYDIAVKYKDSTGSWQNARAYVTVTAASNNP